MRRRPLAETVRDVAMLVRRISARAMPVSIKARCSYTSEWRAPWKPDSVCRNVAVTRWPRWVRALRGATGVYCVRDARSRVVLYVGRSRACLRSALVRHFNAWGPDPRGHHRRVVLDRATVEVKVYIVRRAWASATEADLIAMLHPEENLRGERAHRTARGEVPF